MKITDQRLDCKSSFRQLCIGDVFEYVEAFYIKTGVAENAPNAVDLRNGRGDIIRLDAEVDLLDAELIVNQKGADNE